MIRTTLIVLSLSLALAGCGGSDKSPPAPSKAPAPPVRLGVKVTPVTAPMFNFSRKAGFPFRPHGVVVLQVVAGSPAARAGVHTVPRPGSEINLSDDEIVAIDGRPVSTGKDLVNGVRGRRPGDTITLSVARPGKRGAPRHLVTVHVTLSGG